MRKGSSSATYQDEVIRATAGRKGPSAKPTAKRAAAKPPGERTKGKRIVGMDQPSLTSAKLETSTHIMTGMTMRGLYLARMREPGSWVIM
jgi:hypothetical protein